MRTVRKVASRESGNDGGWELESAEDRTVERRVRVAAPPSSLYTTRLTRRMTAIDPRILAIARGDAEPEAPAASAAVTLVRPGRVDGVEDDPFGGLIPVLDDETTEVEESWLEESPASGRRAEDEPATDAANQEGVALDLDLDLDLDFEFADGEMPVEDGWLDDERGGAGRANEVRGRSEEYLGVEPEPFSLPGLRKSG
jgi:hypothetical protein